MLKLVPGDLFKATDYGALIHGCNCFNTMGGGVAAIVAKVYPEAMMVDDLTKIGDESKLGKFTYCNVDHAYSGNLLTVVNAYTQFQPGRNYDYAAIESALTGIDRVLSREIVVAMPKIGAGIAGGDWDIIQKIMEKAFFYRNAIVYYI